MNKPVNVFSKDRVYLMVGMFVAMMLLSACLIGSVPVEPDPDPDPSEPILHFINPYADVDWHSVQEYHGNLHTHTRYSDGSLDPHQAIDAYKALGYSILALTDHDTHHDAVRPHPLFSWMDLNDIYHEIKDEINPSYDETWGYRANEEWQSRDPEYLDMVAIQGNEISRPHHIGSLFNDYGGGAELPREAFLEIEARGGLSMFYHPGRYTSRDAHYTLPWYLDHYYDFDSLIGMEVYNRRDNHPEDRDLWDQVLHQFIPHRPVWGFANDDMHHPENDLGWNRNIFMLTELNLENVRHAMETGSFFFFKPANQGDAPSVYVENVLVTETDIQLTINGDVDQIQWVTFDPVLEDSSIFHYGSEISMDDLPEGANFVRAIVIEAGQTGRLYTQPFGVERGDEFVPRLTIQYDDFADPDFIDQFTEPYSQEHWGNYDFRDLVGEHFFAVEDGDNRLLKQTGSRLDIHNITQDFRVKFRVKMTEEWGSSSSISYRVRYAWPNEYRLSIRPDSIHFHRDLDGDVEPLFNETYSQMGASFSALEIDTWYDIEYSMVGDTFKLSINGEELIEVVDPDPFIRHGRLALQCWRTVKYYDEFLIEWYKH